MRVDIYSHNFAISQFTGRDAEVIFRYLSAGLVQWGFDRVDGKYKRVKLRTYAASNRSRNVFRLHLNSLPSFKTFLQVNGYDWGSLNIIKHEIKPGEIVNYNLIDKRAPREYQLDAISYCGAKPIQGFANNKLITIQTGMGKLGSDNSKVKIPGGWKRLGDIEVGDVITAADGNETTVNGVYPHGVVDLYKVSFYDGRSTICGAEHMWKVFWVNVEIHKRWRVVDTLEMQRLLTLHNPRLYVPLIQAEDSDPVAVIIPPYTLGVLLGDGCFSGGSVTITKLDIELFDRVKSELISGTEIKQRKELKNWALISDRYGQNPYTVELRRLRLMGKCAWDKFIPEHYLHGSRLQRLELLRGLLDTDGTVSSDSSSVSFCSTSIKLAEGVQYLVRSLGGIASISIRKPHYTYKGEKLKGRDAYEVNIRYPRPTELFTIPRKLERCYDDGQYSADLKLRVKSVEKVEPDYGTCIRIDHPDSLYVTDDFIVTHNTMLALRAILQSNQRCVCIIKGMYVAKWIEDYEGSFGKRKGELMVVRGSKDLKNLIALAQANELKAKFIIITNTTMYNFLSEFELMPEGDNSYGIHPIEFFPLLGVGIRLIDEVHQDFHLNFRLDLYTHCPLAINLSATMNPDDPFIKKMYELMFPLHTRFAGVPYNKYINVKALKYSLIEPRKIRYKHFQRGSYNQPLFEQSIIRNKSILANYLSLITHVVNESFIKVMSPGQKMLIFAGTVEMCTIITEHLNAVLNKHNLLIRRYTSEEPFSFLMESDISVSTLKSAGTAVDIPGLRTTLMTDALNSQQANDQAVGRLRELKQYPDVKPEFIYFVCNDIPKHYEYHLRKVDNFNGKVLTHQLLNTGFRL